MISSIVIILHASAPAPPVHGIIRPHKKGGYKDSSADIAFALAQYPDILVVTPVAADQRDPVVDTHWSWGDSTEDLLQAIEAAKDAYLNLKPRPEPMPPIVIWANTVLYPGHPLEQIVNPTRGVFYVGQPLERMDLMDDKYNANEILRNAGLHVPRAFRLTLELCSATILQEAALQVGGFPLVFKPIRGRGSTGVQVLHSLAALQEALTECITSGAFGDSVMLEEYLPGSEITVAVLPPGISSSKYRALPAIERTGHRDGVMPFSGDTPVALNSAVATPCAELESCLTECEHAALLLGARAMVRIDCRQPSSGMPFYLFDFNPKPNLTDFKRPGRSSHQSLVSMALLASDMSFSEYCKQSVLAAAASQQL